MKLYTHRNLGFVFLLGLALGMVFSSTIHADTFGSGANTFEIEFVTIGDPGNMADTNGGFADPGGVGYIYGIGKYEVSESMFNKANILGNLGLSTSSLGPNKPATEVTWFEAAQFVNWLNTSTGHSAAYKFDDQGDFQLWEPGDTGYNPNNLFRNNEAIYVLPNVDEWYKAAYYDPSADVYNEFPTGGLADPVSVLSGTTPGTAVFMQGGVPFPIGPADITQAGGLSPYGTMAQGGNVGEWQETELDLINDDPVSRRIARGGEWDSSSSSLSSNSLGAGLPTLEDILGGFRVVSVPEPSSLMLFSSFLFALGLKGRAVSRCRI